MDPHQQIVAPAPNADGARVEDSIRETIEAIVMAFLLAFVFRAFVVEAFVIPTGSMAPTLLGEHYRLRCEMCGYGFTVGARDDDSAQGATTPCPMCGYRLTNGGRQAGDRILVLKYAYEFVEPRRWDVIVFKNPSRTDEFDENYIKRLAGLPGEQVWIVDGNLYTRPAPDLAGGDAHPEHGGGWAIQRKPPRVQRAVWQPVYHSDYYPLDAVSRRWTSPWQPAGPTADRWEFQRAGPRWHYAGGDGSGELAFDFGEYGAVMRWPYNEHMGTALNDQTPPLIEELSVAATVTPLEPGGAIELWCSDRGSLIRGVVEPDGAVRIERSRDEASAAGADPSWTALADGRVEPLEPRKPRRLELWSVDRAIWLWVDGEVAARWQGAELHPGEIAAGDVARRVPRVRIVIRGCAAFVRSADLDRDLFYTQAARESYHPDLVPDAAAPLGSMNRPATVPPGEFFVLGDNSPWSGDSRGWTQVNPWIERLTGVEPGFVPREMVLGRAFFVYFPARWTVPGTDLHAVPNFGAMRFIR